MAKNRGHRNKHTEQRAIWFLTKEPKTYNAERTASLTHGCENTGYLHAEGRNCPVITPPIQMSFQSVSKTLM
jgi:hypothetical protein